MPNHRNVYISLATSMSETGQFQLTPLVNNIILMTSMKSIYMKTIAIPNVRIGLEKENIAEFRISRHGDLNDKLIKAKLRELLAQEFGSSNIEIIICYGNVSTPPEELRTQIISENHESEIEHHKEVYKTYRRIRERYKC